MLLPKLTRITLIYGLLIVGSLIFTFPFVWMAATSMKVDRELFTDRELRVSPIPPRPRQRSPYVDDAYFPRSEDKRAHRLAGEIEKLVHAAKYPFSADFSRADAEREVAYGLYKRMAARIPKKIWEGPLPALREALEKEITAASIAETFDSVQRRLSLRMMLARSTSLREEEIGKGMPFSKRLENQTPRVARLTDCFEKEQAFAGVSYDFTRGDKFVLSKTVSLGFAAEELQRLQLYLRPDDSWHELWLTLESNGRIFRARRAVPLANMDWMCVTWQQPGPEDNTLNIKTWILLDRVKHATSAITDPRQIKVTLEFRKSTPTVAWMDKIKMNYDRVLDQIPFWRYIRVSIFLVFANILLAVIVSSLVAYAFARLQWPGRDFAFLLLLATMMIPGQVTMIPHFLIWKNIGAYNTLTPLWLGAAFGNAFFIFLLRQTLKGIPRDLEDAARIDGCGYLRVYWHIMLPLIKPSLAAIAIFTFMGTWNDFMGPLIYISDQRLYPLAFGIYAFSVQVGNNPALMMAASLLMTLPVIVIFFLAQRYFIQGITLTGMKG